MRQSWLHFVGVAVAILALAGCKGDGLDPTKPPAGSGALGTWTVLSRGGAGARGSGESALILARGQERLVISTQQCRDASKYVKGDILKATRHWDLVPAYRTREWVESIDLEPVKLVEP